MHEHLRKLEVTGRTAMKWHVNNTVLITLQESLVCNRVYFNLIWKGSTTECLWLCISESCRNFSKKPIYREISSV